MCLVHRSIQIALKVLRELKRGPESPWHAYLQALPTQFDTLIHWTPQELSSLQMNCTADESAFIDQVLVLWLLMHHFSFTCSAITCALSCFVPIKPSQPNTPTLVWSKHGSGCVSKQTKGVLVVRMLKCHFLCPFVDSSPAASLPNLTLLSVECNFHSWTQKVWHVAMWTTSWVSSMHDLLQARHSRPCNASCISLLSLLPLTVLRTVHICSITSADTSACESRCSPPDMTC